MNWVSKLFSKPKRRESKIYCVPAAIACAWAWAIEYKDRVQIIVQKISTDPDRDHVQAEAFVDGKWQPLIMEWTDKGPVAVIGHRHFDVEPYRYVSLRRWVDEQIKWTD